MFIYIDLSSLKRYNFSVNFKRMSKCESCKYLANPCPGMQKGAFCTEMTQEEHMIYHPAVTDPNGAMACEISYFYEQPALNKSRNQG